MSNQKLSLLKVAIVHDWLIGGGAERVVLELHKMFPEAPIYTSYCTPEWRAKLDNRVVTGFLQHRPLSRLRKFIPYLRIWWFSQLKFNDYDLVISSSGAEAKGIHVPKGTIHINYCHAPTHYYWSRYEEYMMEPGFGIFNPLARIGLRTLVGPLRKWDLRASQSPDYMVANSTYTQQAIKRYYNRDSIVIFPPVDLRRFDNSEARERTGYVTAGRQTPYKRIDIAVQACTKLGLPLEVIGRGPEHRRLTSLAGPSIKFLANISDSEIARHFSGAKAFIFPGMDDFGIVAVEALAAGTPVVAYKAGGALDYVEEKTGLFFEKQSVDSLCKALGEIDSRKFDPGLIRHYSERFSSQCFKDKMESFIESVFK